MMRFTASQAFPCRSGIGEPHTTVIGQECAYVEPGPRMICGACIPLIVDGDVSTAPAPVELCTCGGQRHWTDAGNGVWVHTECGRPGFGPAAPDVDTNLPALLAQDAERAENAAVAAAVGSAVEPTPAEPGAVVPVPVGAPVHAGDVPTQLTHGAVDAAAAQTPVGPSVPDVGVIVCEPPKRRGRPPKPPVAPGLIVEKLPGADKWCVVHEHTASPIVVGMSSKAKATETLTRFGQTAIDWAAEQLDGQALAFAGNEQMRLVNPRAYQENVYRDAVDERSAGTAGAPAPDPASGPGVAAGIAGGGVSAPEGAERPGSEGSRGAEGIDQTGIAATVPGTTGGDSHEPEHADAAQVGMPYDATVPIEGSQGSASGILGIVGGILGPVVPSPTVTGHTFTMGGVDLASFATPIAGQPDTRIDESIAGAGPDPRIETRDGHVVVWPAGVGGYAGGAPVGEPLVPGPAAVAHGQVPGAAGASPDPAPGRGGPVGGAVAAPAPTDLGMPGTLLGYADTTPVVLPPQNPTPANMPGTVIDTSKPSLAAFFAGTKSVQMAGSSPWAAAYAAELREIVEYHASRTDRNLQVHLGPSEIGTPCDRQVVGKLVGFPSTNHVSDPWPSFMGTAGHAAMEGVFGQQNEREGWERFFTERKVTPHEQHRGTSDLYDQRYLVVDDHKFLGDSSMAKLRSPEGPPVKYQFQLKLYARGYRNAGYRVDRIAIIGWPRTASSIDGMYVWDHVLTPEDDEQIEQLFARMAWRQDVAERIRRGQMYLSDVPAVPDADDCYFCPFYRPQSAKDGGPGCPGHAGQ